MIDMQFPLPGFTPDPDDPHAGFFSDASGRSTRVFLKRSRTPERHDTEMAALALLHQHSGDLPVPRLIAQFSDESGPVLVLSYEAGINLADLLTPTLHAPPLPPWYKPVHIPFHPPISELTPLLLEIGQAVRVLHDIRLVKFGKLVGQEPNPHRWDARAYTHQEIAHRIRMSVEKGFLSPALVQAIERWVSREIDCLTETEPPCLVHYDLHAGNVRVFVDPSTGAWRLRALYDFELARGWSPEWDLAALQWDLKNVEEDAGQAWGSFLAGYGPVDPIRLRLFEALRALSAIAYTDRYPEWGAWCLPILTELVESR